MDILKEAIADANKLKELAYENAKVAIEETFQPKIQRMISTKLAEEEYEEEMPPEMEPEMAPAEDDMQYENYIDDGKNGTPDNPIKNDGNPQTGLDEDELAEEFDAIIKELEGGTEELQEKDDAYDDKVSSTKKNIGEMEEPEVTEDVDENLDNLSLEALVKTLEEEEAALSQEATPQAPAPAASIDDLRAENAKLKEELEQARLAIVEMKSTMNEVNLLNTKLMFSSKIINQFDLTEDQKVKVLETFDRAQSVREVKLIWSTIHENYKNRQIKSNRKPVVESASKTVTTVKAESKENLMESAHRWQQLAGMKPLNN